MWCICHLNSLKKKLYDNYVLVSILIERERERKRARKQRVELKVLSAIQQLSLAQLGSAPAIRVAELS